MRTISLILYKMTSDNRCAVKDLVQVGGTLTDIKFKAPTDLLNPTLLLDLPTIHFNYCKLKIEDGGETQWERYYFLKEPPTFELGGLHSISLHEDILSSVWDKLKTRNAHIERSETRRNRYIIDETQGVETTRDITFSSKVGSLGSPTGNYIAVTVAGGI